MRVIVWLLAAVLIALSGSALAGGLPCSGARGGIIGCDGGAFMCADGAVSKSKKICEASEYSKVAPVVSAVASAPEKSGYTLVDLVLGMFVAVAVWAVLSLLRWAWLGGRLVLRYYNAHAEKRNN